MRLMITLARPGAWVADVVVDADPLTCVRDVVKNAVDGLDPSRHPCDGLDLTTLYVGRTVVDAAAPLSTSGVRAPPPAPPPAPAPAGGSAGRTRRRGRRPRSSRCASSPGPTRGSCGTWGPGRTSWGSTPRGPSSSTSRPSCW